MMELNLLVSVFYPDGIGFMPTVLVAFAYGRILAALVLFKNKHMSKLHYGLYCTFPQDLTS